MTAGDLKSSCDFDGADIKQAPELQQETVARYLLALKLIGLGKVVRAPLQRVQVRPIAAGWLLEIAPHSQDEGVVPGFA